MSRLIRKIAQLEQEYEAHEREVEDAQRTVQAYYDRGIRPNELPYVKMGYTQVRLDAVPYELREHGGKQTYTKLQNTKEIERDFGPFEDRELSMGLSISKSPGTEGFTVVTLTDSATGLKTSARGRNPLIPISEIPSSVTNAVREAPHTQMLIVKALLSWLRSVDPVRSAVVERALHEKAAKRGQVVADESAYNDPEYNRRPYQNRSLMQVTDIDLKYVATKAGILIEPRQDFVRTGWGSAKKGKSAVMGTNRTFGYSVTDMLAD